MVRNSLQVIKNDDNQLMDTFGRGFHQISYWIALRMTTFFPCILIVHIAFDSATGLFQKMLVPSKLMPGELHLN